MIDETVPIAGSAIGAALVLMWGLYLRFFVVVPPNEALVIFGGSRPSRGRAGSAVREDRGIRVVVGGGAFVAPWIRQYGVLPLSIMDLTALANGVSTKDGRDSGRYDVRVTAQVKIASDHASLARAAESLLGRSEDDIKGLVRNVIEGHVPGVLAKIRLADLEAEWGALNEELHVLVAADLWLHGINVDFLAVKQVTNTPAATGGPALMDRVLPTVQLPDPDDSATSVYHSLGIHPIAVELPGPRARAGRDGLRLAPSSRALIPEEAGA